MCIRTGCPAAELPSTQSLTQHEPKLGKPNFDCERHLFSPQHITWSPNTRFPTPYRTISNSIPKSMCANATETLPCIPMEQRSPNLMSSGHARLRPPRDHLHDHLQPPRLLAGPPRPRIDLSCGTKVRGKVSCWNSGLIASHQVLPRSTRPVGPLRLICRSLQSDTHHSQPPSPPARRERSPGERVPWPAQRSEH